MPFNGGLSEKRKVLRDSNQRKRVLFCATVDFHFKKFHLPTLKWFQEQGWEVHVAAAGEMPLQYVDVRHQLAISRSPFRTNNLLAFQELKRLLKTYSFDLIHCHTPMGGVLTRLAARNSRKKGTKVFYTAHGFHFCTGAPLLNWLLYYPIERLLARWTDCLITINEEDYSRARNHNFKAKQIVKVNGVGVDTRVFKPVSEKEKHFLRSSFGYNPEEVLLFYAAEFNTNKNQQFLIHALAELKEAFPQTRLLLAGDGSLQTVCRELAEELNVQDLVKFLGYQDNVLPYLQMADIAVASSLREGLPVNIMEAMACGLPIVATDNRGHRELINQGENGSLITPSDTKCFSDALKRLIGSQSYRSTQGNQSRIRVQPYAVGSVQSDLNQLYLSEMEARHESQSKYHRAHL